MDFNLTEEQQMLRDGAERFVREQYDFETRRALADKGGSFSENNWQQFAALGWLALGLPEDCGGFGLDFVEITILMQELGRGLVLEPVISTSVLGARIIEGASDNTRRNDLLPKIAEGSLRVALAHSEGSSRFNLSSVSSCVERQNGGYSLSGVKFMVFDAPLANQLIVSARLPEAQGFSLFLVDKEAEGVTLTEYDLIDGTRAADIRFENVLLPSEALLVDAGNAQCVLEEAIDRAIVAQVAEVIGAMEAVMDITAEYLKARKQFGQPIGKFQALQHRMAEMLIQVENARSMLYRGLAYLDGNEQARKEAVSAAKVVAANAAKFVSAQGVQLHGGIGLTDEYSISHYFKKLTVFEKMFGDISHHTASYIMNQRVIDGA